jgi:hypothetical protein
MTGFAFGSARSLKPPEAVMRPAMLFAVLCSITACGDTGLPGLPAGPSDLSSGVVFYEAANFTGSSALVTSDIPNLGDFDGPCEHTGDSERGTFYDWNDCVSSFRVAPGWRATVYEQRDYKGESYMTTEDTGNLQLVRGTCSHDGLNDCVSSVRVVRVE